MFRHTRSERHAHRTGGSGHDQHGLPPGVPVTERPPDQPSGGSSDWFFAPPGPPSGDPRPAQETSEQPVSDPTVAIPAVSPEAAWSGGSARPTAPPDPLLAQPAYPSPLGQARFSPPLGHAPYSPPLGQAPYPPPPTGAPYHLSVAGPPGEAAASSPVGATAPTQSLPLWPVATSPTQSPPTGVAPGAPSAGRRGGGPGWGWLLAAAAVIALVSASIGAGVVVLATRGATRTVSVLPEPVPGSTVRPEGSIADISARALPSVVTIRVESGDDAGSGSGFVIDAAGHILTNNHVVSAAAASGDITVVFNDLRSEKATIVGRDSSYDLAVLKIDSTTSPPLSFGSSADVVVGDGVIAMGAPLGLDATVTSGIVSALNRPVSAGDGDETSYINAIQTDAAINPGNSGGPLLDMAGRVIGINSAIARIPGSTGTTGGNIGVGFAIPSDQARKTADQLIRTGKAERPVIGIQIDRTYEGVGVKILEGADGVTPDGPADKAGLRPGDIITEFDGRPVPGPDELVVAIRAKDIGAAVSLKATRDGVVQEFTLNLVAATSG